MLRRSWEAILGGVGQIRAFGVARKVKEFMHKRVELLCDDATAFVIVDLSPDADIAKADLDTLLADWIESSGITEPGAKAWTLLEQPTRDYLQELRTARAISCGTMVVEEPRYSRLTALYQNAKDHFPDDLEGL